MTLRDTLTAARDNLADVERALHGLWEDLYAPDGPGPEVKRRNRGKRSDTPALWHGAKQVQAAYNDVLDELARAHWELGRHTDVPVHWTQLPTDEWVSRQREEGGEPLPTWRKATVPHSEALAWTRILAGMLEWAAENHHDTEQAQAVERACHHITAAHGRIDDLWPWVHEPLPDPRPACIHCGDREPERDRKWCSFCRRAHKRDTGRCQACGIDMAHVG